MDAADTMRIAAVFPTILRAAKGVSFSSPDMVETAVSSFRLQESSVIPSDPLKIRVGFLSRFLMRSHSLGQHIRGVMQHLDRSKFHVIAIHIKNDAESYGLDDMIGLADEDISISSAVSNLHESRIRVAGTKLDVLVFPDIGREAVSYFLAFSRLAPVQIATWCFPASLGTGQIDYFLSADGLEPDSVAGNHYWEQLVQFRGAPPWFFLKEDALRIGEQQQSGVLRG